MADEHTTDASRCIIYQRQRARGEGHRNHWVSVRRLSFPATRHFLPNLSFPFFSCHKTHIFLASWKLNVVFTMRRNVRMQSLHI